MSGKFKAGFSLLEILVVVAIIGIIMATTIPNLASRKPEQVRKKFIEEVNAITRLGWHRALIERKIHRVMFDFTARQVWLEKRADTAVANQEEFVKSTGAYIKSSFAIPASITIENFIIEGFDEKTRSRGGTSASWFYILPDGLTQAVTINFTDAKQPDRAHRPRKFGLVLNPFTAQFTAYDSFQK